MESKVPRLNSRSIFSLVRSVSPLMRVTGTRMAELPESWDLPQPARLRPRMTARAG